MLTCFPHFAEQSFFCSAGKAAILDLLFWPKFSNTSVEIRTWRGWRASLLTWELSDVSSGMLTADGVALSVPQLRNVFAHQAVLLS